MNRFELTMDRCQWWIGFVLTPLLFLLRIDLIFVFPVKHQHRQEAKADQLFCKQRGHVVIFLIPPEFTYNWKEVQMTV